MRRPTVVVYTMVAVMMIRDNCRRVPQGPKAAQAPPASEAAKGEVRRRTRSLLGSELLLRRWRTR